MASPCRVIATALAKTDTVQQVNWVQLNPGAVTDWHAHAKQIDHLVGVSGNIIDASWQALVDAYEYHLTHVEEE
jgi:hypothetical protein